MAGKAGAAKTVSWLGFLWLDALSWTPKYLGNLIRYQTSYYIVAFRNCKRLGDEKAGQAYSPTIRAVYERHTRDQGLRPCLDMTRLAPSTPTTV
jgi:hypothetical protein